MPGSLLTVGRIHFTPSSKWLKAHAVYDVTATTNGSATYATGAGGDGPVMPASHAYTIFWMPSGYHFDPTGSDQQYMNLINRYLSDVGGTSFYNIVTQYTGSNRAPGNVATLAGTWVDTTPYYQVSGGPGRTGIGTQLDPIHDAQIQAEVTRAIQANGWPAGLTNVFYVFTPANVWSGFAGGGTSYVDFCGYHSNFNAATANPVIYASIVDPFGLAGAYCLQPRSPNGDLMADAAVTTVAHEQVEAATDPLVGYKTAWNGTSGEIADLCTNVYGTRNSSGANLELHGNPYSVQEIYSNNQVGCSSAYNGPDMPGGTPSLVVNPIPLPDAAEGQPYSQTLTALNAPPAVTWSVDNAPPWLSLNASTGTLSGTPTVVDQGTVSLTVYANTVSQDFTFQVVPSSVTDVSVIPTSTVVGSTTDWAVYFATTSALTGSTGSVTITAPAGTVLPTSNLAYTVTDVTTSVTKSVIASPSIAAGPPPSVTLMLPATVQIGAGDFVKVVISNVQNPTTAGWYSYKGNAVTVSTSQDTLPAYTIEASLTTNVFDIGLQLTPDLAHPIVPAFLQTPLAAAGSLGAGQSVNTLVAVFDQYGNPIVVASNNDTVPVQLSVDSGAAGTVTATGYDPSAGAVGGAAAPVTLSSVAQAVYTDMTGVIDLTYTAPNTLPSAETDTITASDTSGQSADSYSYVGPPTISTSVLPAGTVGSAYDTPLAANGGTAPYTWQASGLPTGLSLTVSGSTYAITGTPTEAGSFTVHVAVTDSNAGTATRSLSLTVNKAATTTTLTSGANPSTVGQTVVYTATVGAATGGTPTGDITFEDGGTAIGGCSSQPLSSGQATCTVTYSATGTHSITALYGGDGDYLTSTSTALAQSVVAGLTITTASLPPGTVGSAYGQTLQAAGGTAPYTWSIASGSLPAGLGLNTVTGVVYGTPTAAGTSSFTVQVTDSATPTAGTARHPFTVTIDSATPTSVTLSIGTATLPAGTAGAAYTAQLAATGGTTPYTWSLSGGALPPGLNLSTGGAISGTLATPGTFGFTVKVTDSTSPAQEATEGLSLTVSPLSLAVATGSFPAGMSGRLYTATLVATGGTAPYTWSLTSGRLPAGLSLNSATGAVYGTPSGSGTTPLTVQVSDAASHTATAALTLQIAPPGLAVTTQSLPGATVGTAYSAQLSASNGTAPYTWALASGSAGLPAGLSLNTVTGAVYGTPNTAGPFIFAVQVRDSAAHTAAQTLALLVSAASGVEVNGTSAGSGSAGGEGTATPDTVIAGSGTGSVAVAEYGSDPVSGTTTAFTAAGTYFDAAVAAGSSFTQVTIQECGLSAGQLVYWYDTGTSQWALVDPQSLDMSTGCTTLGPLTGSTSPTLTQLGGTPFAVAQAPASLQVGTGSASYAAGATVTIDGTLANAAAAPVTLTVTDPQGATAFSGTATPGSNGAFTAQFALNSGAQPGVYTVEASATPASGSLDASATFTVTSAPAVFVGGGGGGGGYVAPVPVVTGISPSGGPAAGGTAVTISGTGFTGATAVDFGADVATDVQVESATQILATSPAGTGTVDVTVTTPSGTSATSAADQFTYAAAAAAPAPPATPKAVTFSDVPSSFWAYGAIEQLAGRGIVAGFPDGRFRPDAAVTRAQFVKMLVLTLGLKHGTAATRFADVAPSAWYAPYVSAAVHAGIVKGTSPTTFSPDQPVTREQMALLVARALKLSKTAALDFSDDAQIGAWALKGVEEAVAAGYINGFPNGTFQPDGTATRAQAAKVLAMVLKHTAS